MTDLEHARGLVSSCMSMPDNTYIPQSLQRLVDKTQNPETSDGSISETVWASLRDYCAAVQQHQRAYVKTWALLNQEQA